MKETEILKIMFRKKVFDFLKENNIDYSTRKVRTYNTRRYGIEIRFYGEPIEMLNSKFSRRKMSEQEIAEHKAMGNNYNSTYGKFSKRISNYIYINEEIFKTDEEKQFTLEMFKYL